MASPATRTAPLSPDMLDEKALYLGDNATANDADAQAKAIVARILSADTAEDIFGGPSELLSAEDMVGQPFTLIDVEARESDIEGGTGVYALLHIARWGTTDTELMTCGARNVMAAAFRGKSLHLLPRGPLTIVEGNKTRAGYTPLWLQDMDEDQADAKAGLVKAKSARTGDEDF